MTGTQTVSISSGILYFSGEFVSLNATLLWLYLPSLSALYPFKGIVMIYRGPLFLCPMNLRL